MSDATGFEGISLISKEVVDGSDDLSGAGLRAMRAAADAVETEAHGGEVFLVWAALADRFDGAEFDVQAGATLAEAAEDWLDTDSVMGFTRRWKARLGLKL